MFVDRMLRGEGRGQGHECLVRVESPRGLLNNTGWVWERVCWEEGGGRGNHIVNTSCIIVNISYENQFTCHQPYFEMYLLYILYSDFCY